MGIISKIFKKDLTLGSHLQGKVVKLIDVNDQTFSGGILGQGLAVYPESNRIVAPCDATVTMIFDTSHAISLLAENGAEILIHIGLDTVNLGGKHFKTVVKADTKVKKGDILIEFDPQAIKADGYDLITPMVILNSNDFKAITPSKEFAEETTIKELDDFLTITK